MELNMMCTKLRSWLMFVVMMIMAASTWAQPASLQALQQSLQQGGLVIVLRHTSSPREAPDAATANADNVDRERQLDAQGRADAAAVGEAIRRADIPVVEVISSPAYRALETAKLAGFEDVTADDLLSNEGMQDSTEAYAQHLHQLLQRPVSGGNRVIITHGPNLQAAFPDEEGIAEGDALIIAPQQQGFRVEGRIVAEEWKMLAGN